MFKAIEAQSFQIVKELCDLGANERIWKDKEACSALQFARSNANFRKHCDEIDNS